MKQAWMNKDFCELIEKVVEQLDEATYLLNEAIETIDDIASDLEDECDDETQDELQDFRDELQWDYEDVIASLSSQLYEMISDN